jgi:hypothetical protein
MPGSRRPTLLPMRRSLTIATVALIIGAFVALVVVVQRANNPKASSSTTALTAPRVGETVREAKLITVDRHAVTVPGTTRWGAIAFVDGLNCRPCLASAKALAKIARTAPKLTAVLVDVNASDGKGEVAQLRARTGWGDRAIVLDTPANDVGSRFDVETIGTVLIYRPGGTITDVLVDPSAAALRRSLHAATAA